MFTFLYANKNGFDIEFTAPTDEIARSELKKCGEHDLVLIGQTRHLTQNQKISMEGGAVFFSGFMDGDTLRVPAKNLDALILSLNENKNLMAKVFDGEIAVFNHADQKVGYYTCNHGFYSLVNYGFVVSDFIGF